jgi:hypothetical protein
VLFGHAGKPQSAQYFFLPSVQFTQGLGLHSVEPQRCGLTPQPNADAAQHAPGQSPLEYLGGRAGTGAGPFPRDQLPALTQPAAALPHVFGQGRDCPSDESVLLISAHLYGHTGYGQVRLQSESYGKGMNRSRLSIDFSGL